MTEMNIRLLIMDVDGTLTDGKILMGPNGEIAKSFNIKDGYAIKDILPKHNIIPAVITSRSSAIVENRCKELQISFLFQNVPNKLPVLKSLLDLLCLTPNDVAYIGDDLGDLECMKFVCVKGCPADAANEIIDICDFISSHKGGEGSVRDFIEWIINQEK